MYVASRRPAGTNKEGGTMGQTHPGAATPTEADLVPYSTWRNLKGGCLYTVLGISTCSTNGPREGKERVVVYLSHAYQKLRHRDVDEFLAKFVPVQPSGGPVGL